MPMDWQTPECPACRHDEAASFDTELSLTPKARELFGLD